MFGNGCDRFCKPTPCYELDDAKIQKFCEENDMSFPIETLAKADMAIARDGREERHLIKGHFYTAAVNRFLITQSRAIKGCSHGFNITHDALYALSVNCGRCHCSNCIERDYLQKSVESAINSLESA